MKFFKGNNRPPIFIISAPRSGTTWLSKMLNVHPEIYCTENRLFGNYADFIQDDNATETRLRVTLDKYIQSLSLHVNVEGLGLSRVEFKEKLLDDFVRSLFEFQRKASKKKIVIDKITPYIGTSPIVLKQINKYYPDAPIIFLLRDGRDVCVSGILNWLKKRPADRSYTDFEIKRKAYFDGQESRPKALFRDEEVEEWAKTWSEPLRLYDQFSSKRRLYVIRYEDMLQNLDEELADLFKFLKVSKSSKIVNEAKNIGSFRQMSEGRQQGTDSPGSHVRKGIAGDWLNYLSDDNLALFMREAGWAMKKFGYMD